MTTKDPRLWNKRHGRGVRRSNLAWLTLLLRGNVAKNRGATLGKDFVPKLSDPPYNGEDDAFADQDAEHISCNQSTIPIRIEELVSFV